MTHKNKNWDKVLSVLILFSPLVVMIGATAFFPVFSTRCSSSNDPNKVFSLQAKSIAFAHLMYAYDHDERFCPAVVDNPESEPPEGTDYAASWMQVLEPYVRNNAVYELPAGFLSSSSRVKDGRTRSWGMPMRWRFYSGSDPDGNNLWATRFGTAMMDGVGGYHRVGASNYFGAGPAKFCGQRGGDMRPRVVPSYTLADIERPFETALILNALSFEYGMTCRLPVPAPRDAIDESSHYYGINFVPRLRFRGMKPESHGYRTGEGIVAFVEGHARRMTTEQLFTIEHDSRGVPYFKHQYTR